LNNSIIAQTRLLAKKGRDFDFNIPKLYSISFMDFDLDFGKGCTEVIQHLSVRNDLHPEVSYDVLQMTFVILPRFKKKESECKTVMDKLLFSLRNGHKLKKVPKNFKERELKDIFNIAEISNFPSDILNCAITLFKNLGKVEELRIDGRYDGKDFYLIELSPDIHFGKSGTFANAFELKEIKYTDMLRMILLNTENYKD
jgi:hypothetical protein